MLVEGICDVDEHLISTVTISKPWQAKYKMIGEQEQNKVWILMIIARSVAVRLLIDTCKYDVNVMLYHYVIGMK